MFTSYIYGRIFLNKLVHISIFKEKFDKILGPRSSLYIILIVIAFLYMMMLAVERFFMFMAFNIRKTKREYDDGCTMLHRLYASIYHGLFDICISAFHTCNTAFFILYAGFYIRFIHIIYMYGNIYAA